MLKVGIYLIIALGILVVGERGMAEEKKPKSDDIQILIYQKGKVKPLDNQSPYFQEVLHECERLFITADSGYKLIMSKERIAKIKKKQTTLEVIYPDVQVGNIRKQLMVYFTKLLIPLTGKFSNGTIFFAGAHAYTLGETKPEYSLLSEYGSINFVLNTQGVGKLKEILQNMSIKID